MLVALAVSVGACGAALVGVMHGEPPAAYARLRGLTDPWTSDPHALVGAVLAPALLGTFVMALAVRTRTPPLPLPRLAHGDTRGLPVLLLTATGLFLLVTGLCWLGVMILA